VAPRQNSTGQCYFLPYVNKVPAHGAISLKLEIVPLTPPGVHQSGRLGSRITTSIFNRGSHLQPDAPGSSVNELLNYYRTLPATVFGGAAARSSFIRTSAVCDIAKGLAAAWSALGLELHTIGIFVPPAHEVALPFDIGAGIGALVDFFGCPEPPEPPSDTPPQPCTPPNPPEDPGDPIPAMKRFADGGGGDPGCDPPVAPANDPNDLVGPNEVGMGGTVTYTVDFENVGPGDAAKVDVLTHLDPDRFDLSTFTLDEVGIGHATAVPSGNASLATVDDWAVNGTTVDVRSSLQANGDLAVDFAGAPTQFEPAYGPFLIANTDANKPAGQGYVRFSVKLKDTVSIGTVFTQQADIVFDQHAFGGTTTPTNVVETTVVPNRHPIVGQVLTLSDKPGVATGKKLSFKTRDTALSGMHDPSGSGLNLYVRSNFTVGSSTDKYVLPASGWQVRGTKYMYKDAKLVNGPIKGVKIDLRTGSLKITGKGAQLTHSLAVMPDSVDLVLLAGGDEYCASFGGIMHNTPLKKFLASVAPAPSTCPTLVFSS
jgi:hypothetical protein